MEKMITIGNIKFSERKLEELDGTQIMVLIPKEEVSSIHLRYGESVEKPILQFVVGVLLCALGFLLGVWPLLGYFTGPTPEGRAPFWLPIASAVTLLVFGGCTIFPIFRMNNYLLVRTASGARKIAVKGATPAEVIAAGREFGFEISNDVQQGGGTQTAR